MNMRIKKLRKALKLTQGEFGSRVGVKANTIGNYELSLRNPSEAVIHSICREYNVNEEWLRYGNGEMFLETEDAVAEVVSELLEEKNPLYDLILDIMHTYDELDEKSKKVFCDVAENLSKRIAKRKEKE